MHDLLGVVGAIVVLCYLIHRLIPRRPPRPPRWSSAQTINIDPGPNFTAPAMHRDAFPPEACRHRFDALVEVWTEHETPPRLVNHLCPDCREPVTPAEVTAWRDAERRAIQQQRRAVACVQAGGHAPLREVRTLSGGVVGAWCEGCGSRVRQDADQTWVAWPPPRDDLLATPPAGPEC